MTPRPRHLRPVETTVRLEHGGRPLPADVDAERSIVGHVLQYGGRALDELGDLRASHLVDPVASATLGAALALHAASQLVDVSTVLAAMHAAASPIAVGEVSRLLDAPAVGYPEQLAAHLVALSRRRDTMTSLAKLAAEGYETTEATGDYLERVEAEVFRATSTVAQAATSEQACDGMRSMLEDMRLAAAGTPRCAPAHRTGIDTLDDVLSGGLRDGESAVIAGGPGMGKSALALSIALHHALEEGGAVKLFSVEMPRRQQWDRAVSQVAGVAIPVVRAAREKGSVAPAAYEKIEDAMERIHAAAIWVDDRAAVTLPYVRAESRRAVAKCGGRKMLVVVDYLQIMGVDASSRSGNREQEIAEISRGMKALAKELGCPVLVLAQINRDVAKRADKRPQLSDLRESGALEQDADVVLFPFRPAYYEQGADPKVAEIGIAKQRNGPSGISIACGFDPATAAFMSASKAGGWHKVERRADVDG